MGDRVNIKKPFIKNGSRTNNKIVSFNFKTISELDLFWTQAYTLLLMDNSNYNAQYLITPHDFFLYSRPDTDTFWLNSNVKNKAVTRLITSHALPIDAEVVRYRKREHGRQIEYILYENPLKNKSNVYMNVVGDYIFKSNFDKKVNEILENKLATLKKLPLQKVDENDIQNILNMKGDFTFTIVESHVKAEKMKQKLKKYFK